MRALGFLLLGTTTCVNLVRCCLWRKLSNLPFDVQFMRRRLPPVNISGGIFNFKAFKYPPFSIYLIGTSLCFLGIFTGEISFHLRDSYLSNSKGKITVLVYIEVSASAANISPSVSIYFLVIANGVAALGRIFMGMLADKVGCLTVMIPWTLLTAVTTYAWPFAKTLPSLLVVAIVYGCAFHR